MDDGSDSRKEMIGNVADVTEVLGVELVFGKEERGGGAVCEEAAVEAKKGGVRKGAAQVANDVWANVAHVASDQNFRVCHGERRVGTIGISLREARSGLWIST